MLVSYELILTNAKKYTVENSMYCYTIWFGNECNNIRQKTTLMHYWNNDQFKCSMKFFLQVQKDVAKIGTYNIIASIKKP